MCALVRQRAPSRTVRIEGVALHDHVGALRDEAVCHIERLRLRPSTTQRAGRGSHLAVGGAPPLPAALDLLLTCDTISDARDKTNERLAAAGQ